ncbi:MAG: TRAP transporter small permease subunit [Rhodocyclaceae bacterium]
MNWTRPLEAVLAVILGVLACLVFLNVILRYGFNSSIMATDEISRYLFVWLTFLGAILATVHNAHVDVRTLVDRLGPRMRAIVDAAALITMIASCVLLLIGSWQQTLLNWSNHEPISGLSSAWMYAACIPAAVFIGGILCARLIAILRGGAKGPRT